MKKKERDREGKGREGKWREKKGKVTNLSFPSPSSPFRSFLKKLDNRVSPRESRFHSRCKNSGKLKGT